MAQDSSGRPDRTTGVTRRSVLLGGATLAAGTALLSPVVMRNAFAQDKKAPVGNYPAGSEGDSVFVGICTPRTGTYAAQGEDEIKGYQLAFEHINNGNEMLSKMSPNLGKKKGVLGKQIAHGVADSEAKPNTAVQAQTRFINQNKAMMITGSVSSAVAVAINKLAEREKTIYLPCITGSNDTTGKDCSRYSFRSCFYAETAANAIAPVLIKNLGKNKKVAFLTPDYTYGHTVRESTQKALEQQGGWQAVTNQLSPLGTTDFSSYLLNIANSGADVVVNINFGRDAVLSIKQAKQFGILDSMKLAIPYLAPFVAEEVGADTMQGVFAGTDYWWTLEDKFELAKMFNKAFRDKYNTYPEWGAAEAYLQVAMWADAVERAGSFYPPDVIKAYEKGEKFESLTGPVHFRAEDHQLVRPVTIVQGKKPGDMKTDNDYFSIVETVDGGPLMQKPDAFGCKLGDYT
ncbi:substrate-binding protein [Pararhizobium mangrovi]|uniref:ABC transporter substrate-binding protein n=1 Tax=Pararhizobium mangrovi TaxID=2590452 RepID=A0A506TYB2_9HYPH|nr:substrate-binding protein [Pararhizobium mangrovi]TPW26188.1 ABC transporter substrate-binding protein [Pararhizobium mangrovi]